MLRTALTLTVLTLAAVRPAAADVVRLANGRTMTVESCAFEGEVAVLVLRGGGTVRLPRAQVAEILPDETPEAPREAAAALAASPWATVARPSRAVLEQMADRIALSHGVERRTVRALVSVESGWNPLAISPKGAMGLMQLMPATARQYGVRDPFDPEENLQAGIRHLRSLLTRLEVPEALAAYNAGESAVRRYGGIPPYRETEAYVRRIVSLVRR